MGLWKPYKADTELKQGDRVQNSNGGVYTVIGIGEEAVTLKKEGSDKIVLEYKVSMRIQGMMAWEE